MIKIYAILFSCLATTTNVCGQFEKGQKIIGGNIGFSVSKNENNYSTNYISHYSNVSINPSLGWFIKSNVLWGIGLSYGYNYQKNATFGTNEVYKTSRNNIGINLFTQKFFPLSHNFFFTTNTGGAVGYTFGKQINSSMGGSEGEITGYNAGLSFTPGLSYRLTPRLLFDANLSNLISVSYFYNETKPKNEIVTNPKVVESNFSLSSSLSNTSLGNVALGFRWLLKSK